MKRILCAVVALLIAYPCYGALWEKSAEETVIRGVTHKSIKRLTENGWQKINVLYADMNDDNVSLKVLSSSKGGGGRETTKTMVQNSGAAAAINADYFNTLISPTYPLGMVYQDGTIKSTPTDPNLGAFAVTDSGIVMDYFTFSASAVSKEGYTCKIDALNKVPVETGGLTALSDFWGKSYGSRGTMAELLVQDGIVTAAHQGDEPFDIPKGGIVLVTNSAINGFLTDNFAVGDKIEVNINITPDVGAIKEATGGGSIIVSGGAVAPFTNEVKGKSQRTAIGVDKSGKTVVMVTVDGRQSATPGMTQTELAHLMIELGCDKALNLDGGGSTTMVTKNRVTGAAEVENYMPTLRAVSTSIGVFGTHGVGESTDLELSLSQDTIVFGSSVEVYAALHDEYMNTVDTPVDSLEISCSDEYAIIKGNVITPSRGGKHTITVTAQGHSKTIDFTAITDIREIHIYPDTLTLESGETHALTLTATDALGNKAQLPGNFAAWSVEKGSAIVSPALVTGGGGGIISASYNNLVAYAAINTKSTAYKRPADVRGVDGAHRWQAGAVTINITGDMPKPKTLLDTLLQSRRIKKLESGILTIGTKDLPALLGGDKKKCDAFNVFDEGGTRFILMGTTPDWRGFINALDGASGNVVIVMAESIYSYGADERELFGDLCARVTDKGGEVMVISSGDTSECRAERRVRYITLAPSGAASLGDLEGYGEKTAYVAIHLGGELTYTFEKN